ncbi:Efflux pump membrane transporter BepE [Lacunisphaera limnophila]|uniref:Efflux pump membrane transporter BepE n=1 Tax=Lacunisphaera limnophila TaxID=1838286 RepID=A0A1D8AXW9_9BACT|nr:efflux RND transporter permease subunit [Lacunisphaera limnophila]AOS45720.1 Efflux pump membrane transporter BepE [Lacunisphaera limnophila]
MRLHEVCIHRPVFTIVLSTVVTLLGLIGLRLIGIREYPATDSPVISINANYSGANAEAIEAQITEPIEEAVNTVAGVKSLTSTSRDGASRIRVEFELGVDLDAAANDVRDQVGRAVRLLPRDVDPPFISKADADGGTVLTFVLRSAGRDLMSLTDVADRVKEQLQTIAQVGAVDILGEKRYSMKLRLNPDRMAAHGLTALDVQAAVRRESVELPGGRIENSQAEMTVQAVARLATPEQFNRMAIRTSGDQVVRLGDIGTAELAPLNERISFTLRGVPMVGLALRAQPGANQIAIADEAFKRLEALRQSLPPDVTLEIASDNTRFVRHAITELRETIVLALLLVVGVIYLFLGSWRATLVPAVVIPISLIGACFVMYVCGFSLNVLTLLGLVLAVGLVVDDAIVVVENVHRKQEEGLAPLEAGAEGTREVFVAVIATSLALIAVFSPIVFLQGATGRLFREFGLVIAGSVAISAFVALTLTPMMAARMGHAQVSQGRIVGGFNALVQRLRDAYRHSLVWILPRRWVTAAVLAGSFVLIALFYRNLPSELAPLEDRNRVTISATGPEGASYDYMLVLMEDLAKRIDRDTPEAALINCQVPASGARSGTGVANTGLIELVLKPKSERKASQADIAERLTRLTRRTPGARFSVSQEPSIGNRRGGNAVQFVVRATNLPELRDGLPTFMEALENEPAFSSVEVDLKFTRPELQVRLDRERLHTMGISATDVAQTLQTSLGAQRVGYFNRDGRQYEVVQQVADEFRTDPGILSQLSVHAPGGRLVTLDNLVEVDEAIAAPQRFRYDRQIAATVSARLAAGYTLEDGINAMNRVAASTLPAGLNTALTGGALEYAESRSSLLMSFGLALAFVFLVLAAQFESWRAPFVIMLTVPLALAGALGALWACGQTINIFSQIGMIMLVGLVTKNGILLVEFAQQRQHAGVAPREAVLEAADLRLRPILMTTIATILGVLPIALALGAGAESRVSMGIGVIGGLVVGTALTLYVIPSVYLLLTGCDQPATAPAPTTPILPTLAPAEHRA